LKFKLIIAAAAASVVISPAYANEARFETRVGSAWVSGVSSEAIGVAIGYDADIGSKLFIGAEIVADTDFDLSSPVIGVNTRFGTNVSKNGKLFGLVGYARDTTFDFDDTLVGLGYQHNIGSKSFVSVQYQRYTDTDVNRATLGIGLKF
jgi:hypothetical protein